MESDSESFAPFTIDGALAGLACHRICYDLLVKQLGYRLKVKDVRHLATKDYESRLIGGDYGGILAYQDQVIGHQLEHLLCRMGLS